MCLSVEYFWEDLARLFTMVTYPSRMEGREVASKTHFIAVCVLAVFAVTYITFITKDILNNGKQ